jgi:hypothetical protein
MVYEDTKKYLEENNQKNCTCLIISVVVMLGLYFLLNTKKGKGQRGGGGGGESVECPSCTKVYVWAVVASLVAVLGVEGTATTAYEWLVAILKGLQN